MSFSVFTLAVTSSPSSPSPRVAPVTKLAVLVAQRHRQAVDLRLGGKRDLLVVRQTQEAANSGDEIDDVLFGKGIIEGEHRHRVANLGESRRGRRTDPLRQAFQRAQLRKARLDRVVTLAQRVIGRIRNGRRILLIITAVMLGYLGLQPRVIGLGLLFSESIDRRSRIFRGGS